MYNLVYNILSFVIVILIFSGFIFSLMTIFGEYFIVPLLVLMFSIGTIVVKLLDEYQNFKYNISDGKFMVSVM